MTHRVFNRLLSSVLAALASTAAGTLYAPPISAGNAVQASQIAFLAAPTAGTVRSLTEHAVSPVTADTTTFAVL